MRPSLTIKYMKALKTQKLGQPIKVEHKKLPQAHGGKMTRQTQQNTQTKRSSAIHFKSLHITEKAGVLNAFALVRTTE